MILFLLVIYLTTGEVKIGIAQAPSLDVCEAAAPAKIAEAEADPTTRFATAQCITVPRGEKA